jgi:hypothetical protein
VAKVARLAVPRIADWCAIDLVLEGTTRTKRIAVAHVDPSKAALAEHLRENYPEPEDVHDGMANVLRTGRSELYARITDADMRARAVDASQLELVRELGPRSAMVVPLNARGRVLGAMTFVMAESG